MAYKNISLEMLHEKYGVKSKTNNLFSDIPLVKPSQWITTCLEIAKEYPIWTEKARSEFIVAPILTEVRQQNNKYISIYSGINLKVDKELTGKCDFIITKNVESLVLNYPIMQVVEAKKQDIDLGIPQCAVQMYASKKFNENKKTPVPYIYGCVTTGREWKFMRLNSLL